MPLGLTIRLNHIVVIVSTLPAFVLQELTFNAWGVGGWKMKGGRENKL
jgi:hypothetical protein